MRIEFNHCGYNHEAAYNNGGEDAVTIAIENCKLRAEGLNFLCAHPRNEGEFGFKSTATRLKELIDSIQIATNDKEEQKSNIDDYQTLITFLDDTSTAARCNKFNLIDSKIAAIEYRGNKNSCGYRVMNKGGKIMREIMELIKNRNIEKGLNQGHKSRILFLIGKLQISIEEQIRNLCVGLGIILEDI